MSGICQPFEHENLSVRSVSNLLQVNAPYAFGKKQLKYLRPLLNVIIDQKLSQNPATRSQVENMLNKHLEDPRALTELKWSTLGSEIALQGDIPLLEMWVNCRSNGLEILSAIPYTHKPLEKMVETLIPHFIQSNQHQQLSTMIKSWTTDQKKSIAQNCDGLYSNSGFFINIPAVLSNIVQPKPPVAPLEVSPEVVSVFPEYFMAQVERGLEDFVNNQEVLKGVAGFIPQQIINLMGLGEQNNDSLERSFEYFKVLPEDLQNATLETIKSSPHAQKLWDASPEFKAFVEKRAINKALENTVHTPRRAKI